MSSLPQTMNAVQIDKTGGVEVLQYRSIPLPVPKPGEVLIKIEYIGINFIDTYFRSGLYPAPSFPWTLGREASGTVAALPSPNPYNFKLGQRVCLGGVSGTYAEYLAAPSAAVVAVPDGISAEAAAAAPLQALTAWTMMHESYEVKKGDTILITAAAGGVGLWLVQMGKYLGAKVIATCSASKVDMVKSVGADVVIDYTSGEYYDKVMQETDGQGVQAVFDGVGKSTFEESFKCVKRKGTMVSFGNASGAVPPFNILRLSANNIKLLRPRLDGYLATREELEKNCSEVWDFLLKGHINVRIHEIYPLKDVARAHQDIEGRKTTGKLLLKP